MSDPTGPADLMIFTAGPFDADPREIPGGAAFGIVVGLVAPRSRGWVRLVSTDTIAPPRIHLGHLSDAKDLEAMLDGLTEARRIARSDPVAAVSTGPEPSPGPRAAAGDPQGLAAWASGAVSTFQHPVGTRAMGTESELGAVTDSRGSVHGKKALTVADASIMPTIPTGTPNLPTIMVTEHIARQLT